MLAHPDDEVLALGAALERFSDARLITVTDGAPADGADARHHGFASLEAYREQRRAELYQALRHAGLSPAAVTLVDPDGGFPVPDQTASLHLAALVRFVLGVLRALQPEAVLTHPYEGGHPDHDACAFAVHAAVHLLSRAANKERSTPVVRPVIVESPYYHAGENGAMRTGTFLEGWTSPATQVRELSVQEQANKRARLACFASQAETLAQFGVERESFRIAPAYDFTQAPHGGQLMYEQFPWGMTGERFRALAAEAAEQLALAQDDPRHGGDGLDEVVSLGAAAE